MPNSVLQRRLIFASSNIVAIPLFPEDLGSNLKAWLKQSYISDGARQFNGTSQWLYHSTTPDLSFVDGDSYLIAFWVYYNSVADTYIADKGYGAGNDNNQNEFLIRMQSGILRFIVRDSSTSNNRSIAYGSAVSTGTWYLNVALYDGVNHKQYACQNDGSITSGTCSGGPSGATPQALRIGRGFVSNYFSGRFDSYMIAKPDLTGMTDGDVLQLVGDIQASLWSSGDGKSFEDITSSELTSWGVKAWLNMNERTGTAYDALNSYDFTASASSPTLAQGIIAGSPADGDIVKQINDEDSSPSEHLVQTTPGKKPIMNEGGINGVNSLTSDGIDDCMVWDGDLQALARTNALIAVIVNPSDGQPASIQTIFGAKDAGVDNEWSCSITTAGKIQVKYESNTNAATWTSDDVLANGSGDPFGLVVWIGDAGFIRVWKAVSGSYTELASDGVDTGDISGATLGDFTLAQSLYFMAVNNNGTAGQFFSGDVGEIGIQTSATEANAIGWASRLKSLLT